MPYKRRIRVADIVLSLRQEILAAHTKNDKDAFIKLQDRLDHLLEIAYSIHDAKVAGLLEDMIYAVNHFLGGVDFKALAAIPSPEVVEELEAAAAQYTLVQAKLVRRATMKKERRPPNLGYKIDATGAHLRIDPDWVGIAHASGPYTNTIDFLCYKLDGTLISCREFPTLEKALDYAEQKCGIQASEWELCDIDITHENSGMIRSQGGG